MPEWIFPVLVIVANAAAWFWLGWSAGKASVRKKMTDETVRVDDADADALEGAADEDGMPIGEWILRQAVAEARRRQGVMGEENRVLTWAELCALEDGTTVYLEEMSEGYPTGLATITGEDLVSPDGSMYSLDPADPSEFYVGCAREFSEFKIESIAWLLLWRVWLREPTAEELAANPWPTPIAEV